MYAAMSYNNMHLLLLILCKKNESGQRTSAKKLVWHARYINTSEQHIRTDGRYLEGVGREERAFQSRVDAAHEHAVPQRREAQIERREHVAVLGHGCAAWWVRRMQRSAGRCATDATTRKEAKELFGFQDFEDVFSLAKFEFFQKADFEAKWSKFRSFE